MTQETDTSIKFSQLFGLNFIAGMISSLVSRCSIAPLERLI